MAWLQPKRQTLSFLTGTSALPVALRNMQEHVRNHLLRLLEERIPFERGLGTMHVSRGICCAQTRRNKPINGWNASHPGELQGL